MPAACDFTVPCMRGSASVRAGVGGCERQVLWVCTQGERRPPGLKCAHSGRELCTTVPGEVHGLEKSAWLFLEVCLGPGYAHMISGACATTECEFRNAGLRECAPRVGEGASWSEGPGLGHEGAPGCGECPPRADCCGCGCATRMVPVAPG